MDILFQIIILLASILLTFLVFVQNPKGGGLSSDFGSAAQLGGVQKTNDFVVKGTWTLAGIIALFSILLTLRTSTPAPTVPDQPTKTDQPAEGGTQTPG